MNESQNRLEQSSTGANYTVFLDSRQVHFRGSVSSPRAPLPAIFELALP